MYKFLNSLDSENIGRGDCFNDPVVHGFNMQGG